MHVPDIYKNLLSITHFSMEKSYDFLMNINVDFHVKNKATGKIILIVTDGVGAHKHTTL